MNAVPFRPAALDGCRPPGARAPRVGQIPPPSVPEAKRSAIAAAAAGALDALELEIETVGARMDAVSPASLRTDPQGWNGIDLAGAGFGPYEIRTVLAAAMRELWALARRIATGPLSHYLSEDQAGRADRAGKGALSAVASEEALDREPVQAGHERAAERHVQAGVARVKPLVEAAERLVVEGEAQGVPVREPSERGPGTLEIAVGVGAVAVGALLLWQFLA